MRSIALKTWRAFLLASSSSAKGDGHATCGKFLLFNAISNYPQRERFYVADGLILRLAIRKYARKTNRLSDPATIFLNLRLDLIMQSHTDAATLIGEPSRVPMDKPMIAREYMPQICADPQTSDLSRLPDAVSGATLVSWRNFSTSNSSPSVRGRE